MKRYVIIAVIGFIVCCLSAAAADWKSYRAKGSDLRVELIPDKSTMILGEPIYVSLVIRNISKRNLQVMVGKESIPESSNRQRFIFSARRADGVSVMPPPLPVHYTGPLDIRVGPNNIPAGKSYSFERFLPHELPINTPGKYTLRCQKRIDVITMAADGGWDQKQKPDSVDTDCTAEITVLPPDAKRMGDVIDRLGKTMTANNPDEGGCYDSATRAGAALNSIQDLRAIPWFVKLLRMRNSSYKEMALGALAKFDDSVAFAAIISGLKTRGTDLKDWNTPKERDEAAESVRWAAALALSRCPYPGALPALYALKSDHNETIRLQVVHATGARKTAESDAILTQLAHDPAMRVRDEASRYLGLHRSAPAHK